MRWAPALLLLAFAIPAPATACSSPPGQPIEGHLVVREGQDVVLDVPAGVVATADACARSFVDLSVQFDGTYAAWMGAGGFQVLHVDTGHRTTHPEAGVLVDGHVGWRDGPVTGRVLDLADGTRTPIAAPHGATLLGPEVGAVAASAEDPRDGVSVYDARTDAWVVVAAKPPVPGEARLEVARVGLPWVVLQEATQPPTYWSFDTRTGAVATVAVEPPSLRSGTTTAAPEPSPRVVSIQGDLLELARRTYDGSRGERWNVLLPDGSDAQAGPLPSPSGRTAWIEMRPATGTGEPSSGSGTSGPSSSGSLPAAAGSGAAAVALAVATAARRRLPPG